MTNVDPTDDELSTADWVRRRQQQVGNGPADYARGLAVVSTAIRNGQDVDASTPGAIRALGADQRGLDAAERAAQAIQRGDKGVLSDDDKARIIFNETRSLSGPDIQTAREYLAHALANADETWGVDRGKYASSAPSRIPGGVPKAEAGAYQSGVDAVAAARRQRTMGVDPTNGALNFNFRTQTQSGPFEGKQARTRVGPFTNSYPTKKLPASGIYSMTYR